MFVNVDLALVYSAWNVMDEGRVLNQDCSLGKDHSDVVEEVTRPFFMANLTGTVPPTMLVVEDQPHASRFDTYAKNTARLQGRILDRMSQLGYLDRVIFIPPALWQRSEVFNHSPVWRQGKKGTSEAERAFAACAKTFGYEPPNLLEIYATEYELLKGKERQEVRGPLKKQMTDYVSAFLIGQWSNYIWNKEGTLDVPSAQRYVY